MDRDLEQYARDYQIQPFEPFLVKARQQLWLNKLGDVSNSSILEIGCASAPAFTWISSCKNLLVLEPSTIFYDQAITTFQNSSITYPVEILPLKIEDWLKQVTTPMDVILMSSLLHELPDPQQTLQELRKALSPKGKLFLTVPNAYSFHRRLAVAMGAIADVQSFSGANHHFQQQQVFTPIILEDLLNKTGYAIVEAGDYFIKPFTHAQLQKMVDNDIINIDIINGLMKLSAELPGWGAELYRIVKPL
jgi:SAM-dependent methyltransferase